LQLARQLPREVAADVPGPKPARRDEIRPDRLALAILHFHRKEASIDGPGVAVQVANTRIGSDVALDIRLALTRYDELGGRRVTDKSHVVIVLEKAYELVPQLDCTGLRPKRLHKDSRRAASEHVNAEQRHGHMADKPA